VTIVIRRTRNAQYAATQVRKLDERDHMPTVNSQTSQRVGQSHTTDEYKCERTVKKRL